MISVVQSPLEVKARALALRGGTGAPALRHVLGLLDASRAEVDRLQALALEMERRVTLGGIPPRPDMAWANRGLDGGAHPDYSDLARRTP